MTGINSAEKKIGSIVADPRFKLMTDFQELGDEYIRVRNTQIMSKCAKPHGQLNPNVSEERITKLMEQYKMSREDVIFYLWNT